MAKSKKKKSTISGRLICKNKKAFFDYEIVERMEAGISLMGSEVKSIRAGKISIVDSYCEVEKQELYILQCNISEYPWANQFNHSPRRKRKLLMHKFEIIRLGVKVIEKGLTIIPLSFYINEKGKIKVEIALVRGKKSHDKREAIKARDEARIRSRDDY
ncbi:MAG: SsrA-binding protein SmpB [Deltaproteobacteria bacterium]|nr:SsrA-binding protein SmpB [Deltaproteobacteria bacterium]